LEINSIILAGGKSIRFGHDKILERIGRTSLIEKVISHLDSIGNDIIIVTAEERTFGQLANNPKISIVKDMLPGQGSLGGIYTGLMKSNSFNNLVVAADMPFLNEPLLKYMINVAEGYDLTIPRVGNWYEPLHAIYSQNCIEPIKTILGQGKKVIVELFNYVKVRFVETEEIERFDPKHLSFFNINTREDMEKAKKIFGGAGA
jgi:molybdopterin-guanine dinucleotide biosynthesis protein A